MRISTTGGLLLAKSIANRRTVSRINRVTRVYMSLGGPAGGGLFTQKKPGREGLKLNGNIKR